MPWKYEAQDRTVDVIVDPAYQSDLMELAKLHPVWIVDSPGEQTSLIDESLAAGAQLNLYEINRHPTKDDFARRDNLLMIMGVLDDHYGSYGMTVHGLEPVQELADVLREEGFAISEAKADGFLALPTPGVRQGLLGRRPPEAG